MTLDMLSMEKLKQILEEAKTNKDIEEDFIKLIELEIDKRLVIKNNI